MKTKKAYARSEKQKWRDRYHGKRLHYHWEWHDPIPSYFRKMFNDEKRAKNKQALYRLIAGNEDQAFERDVKDIGWYWW